MKELIAVPHPAFVTDEAALKQLAIMFDRIAIQSLSVMLSNPNDTVPEVTKNLAWLAERGILFELDMEKVASDHDYQTTFNQIGSDLEILMPAVGLNVDEIIATRGDEEKFEEFTTTWPETLAEGVASGSVDPFELLEKATRMTTNFTRLSTSQLRNSENLDAYAVLPSELSSLDHDDGNHDVVKIALPTLPVPDDDVTWQQIIEYRNDRDSQNRFFIIKNWLSDVARGALTPDEAEEKLQHLLDQYRRRLELHQMKTSTTTLEAFVITTTDVLDRFAGFGPGQRALFSMEHRKLALLQGESTAPGSEVAYLIKTKSMFPF